MKIMVKTADIVNSNLWKLFPVINCDKWADVPIDYPGAMGVPITAIDKIGRNDGHSGFLILDMCRPRINGKELYIRIIIRNLRPQLPEEIDLADWLKRCGANIEFKEFHADTYDEFLEFVNALPEADRKELAAKLALIAMDEGGAVEVNKSETRKSESPPHPADTGRR